MDYLTFEKPIEELISNLNKAKELGEDTLIDVSKTVKDIELQIKETRKSFSTDRIRSDQFRYFVVFIRHLPTVRHCTHHCPSSK